MTEPPNHPPTLGELRAKRQAILGAAAAHCVTNIRVFGSVARGDAGALSDVDFLVDLPPDCRGLDFFGVLDDLRRELEAIVGHSVDVISICGPASPEMALAIEREALAL